MAALTQSTATIVQHVLVTISFIMIVVRMAFSLNINKRWTTQDGWLLPVLCCLACLWYTGYVIEGSGTNNVQYPELLTTGQIQRREMASKAAVLSRFCCVSALWCLKFCILAVYTTLVDTLPEYQRFVKYIWTFILVTWIATMAAMIFECWPFYHYWQVYPSPAAGCKTAQIQVYVASICNIVTDLILIIYPMPIVFQARLPLVKQLEICSLFSLGFIIIAFSVVRLELVIEYYSLQPWRTVTGILELFASCCVTNGPIFYRVTANKARARDAAGKARGIPMGGSSGIRL